MAGELSGQRRVLPDGASPASSERSPHEGAALSAHPQGAATQGQTSEA